MDGDRVVEVLLGRAHADGDREALQHLVRPLPDDMAAHDALFLAGSDELHHRSLLLFGERVVHWGETRFVDAHVVAELEPRLLFRHADSAYRRMRENDRRYEVILEMTIGHTAVEAIRKSPSCRDRYRCKRDPAGDIANGRDVFDVRALPVVHGHEPGGIVRDPGGIEI